MKYIDQFLNGIPMYRLVLYALSIFAVIGILASGVGLLAYSIPALLISLGILLAVAYVTDVLGAGFTHRDRNPESALITALILFLILAPPMGVVDALWLGVSALIAIGSKYIFAYRGKHIFNPAAFGAVVVTLLGSGLATWWVATPVLFPAVLVFGVGIVYKLRRFDLWMAFLAAAFVIKITALTSIPAWFISWPTLFFSTIMLTEPLTMPATRGGRIAYGVLTGIVFSSSVIVFGVHMTPALALLIGNVGTFVLGPRGRVQLALQSMQRISDSVLECTFVPTHPFAFIAGQYAEWTLGHEHPDDRGIRRYFTFSSSPDEKSVRLAVRLSPEPSSFKEALSTMAPGETISISNVSGDFTLPKDTNEKLLFIAGGVGITPFISMIRTLRARNETRDIVLVYLAASPTDFAFAQELTEAQVVGVRIIGIPATASPEWNGPVGLLEPKTIARYIPDHADRTTYISGPQGMVSHYRNLLRTVGVRKIKTDYFPGL